uniref:Uncharacterized protein n=1 Tax=Oryza rufipogon TaxID=4529 RepID=A0A0E0PL35_ORYRU
MDPPPPARHRLPSGRLPFLHIWQRKGITAMPPPPSTLPSGHRRLLPSRRVTAASYPHAGLPPPPL